MKTQCPHHVLQLSELDIIECLAQSSLSEFDLFTLVQLFLLPYLEKAKVQ